MSDDYDAVVYDLDGTLVHLAVDWAAARADVAAALEAAGLDCGTDDVWALLRRAYERDLADVAEAELSEHETAGARESRRLPLADELSDLGVPAGVCSLNCEAACRIALDRHDVADEVDAVVGRDSAEGQKPDPEPLLAAAAALDADPAATLFVGDSESDREAADRAGTGFQWVQDRLDGA